MKNKTRMLAGCGMLTAVAVVLQYLEISIPFVPSFIKLDFSDLPELIGAFAYGPVAGILIALVKNIIHAAVSQSALIGELSNFILGATFAAVAGLIYKRHKTMKGAFVGGVVGSVVMAAVSLPSNYFVIYPLYSASFAISFFGLFDIKIGMGFPAEAIMDMYRAIVPSVENLFQALLIFNVPFTLIKGLFCVIISMLIYKPLSPILHGKNNN